MREKLREMLAGDRIVLLDGAMGTELSARGATAGGQANIESPQSVLDIHRRYVDCGCDAITTNTLTMNGIYLQSHNISVGVEEVNTTGAELALEAADGRVCVLGDISSTGRMLEPYGTFTESQFEKTFREQASILARSGVHGFIVETMIDLREAVCAVRACRDAAGLAVLASVSFATVDKGGRTVMGNSAADCAADLTEAGATAIGANCGDLDPDETAEVVSMLKQTTALPLLAQPNAGKPRLLGDQTVFDMDAGRFAKGMARCVGSGARIIGGCCGTTPEHIAAVAERLRR